MTTAPVDPRYALDTANASDLVQKKVSIDAMRKRVSGGQNEEKKLREACEGFESIFLQKMWEQMRKNVNKEGYLHSKDEEAYQSMFDVELAKKMASAGGIGLADMLYEQLGQKLHNASKTTGTGAPRAPLPIEPARPPKPEVVKAAVPASPPVDLYAEVPEEPGPAEEPVKTVLDAALEELAASRDPALDPANANYPMFDLQTGAPMNPVAGKLKEDVDPRREYGVTPMPARVSAPGKAKPSNAVGGVSRSSRQARRAAKAGQDAQAAHGDMRTQGAQPQAAAGATQDGAAARTAQAARVAALQNIQAAQTVRDMTQDASVQNMAQSVPAQSTAQTAPGQSMAQTAPSQSMAQTAPGRNMARTAPGTDPAVPETIQAAPGAIPAATQGEPAGSGNWPVQGEVISSYGRHGDVWNTGVSLAAAPASPVTAPLDGVVSFVGERDGVGHMVLAHEGGLTTHYANVTTALAQGDIVSAGMEFARISAGNGLSAAGTGEAAGRIHFEVRRGELAINPESLLA